MLATLRSTGSLVEARKAAGVTARAVAAACEAAQALQAELEAARQEGVAAIGPEASARERERLPNAAARPARRASAAVEAGRRAAEASARGVFGVNDLGPRDDVAEERPTPKTKRLPATHEDGEIDIRATLQAFREEAAELHGPGLYGLLLLQEARLVAAGFHLISPWWLSTVEAFLASLKRWLLILAGRGAGKSTMLTRLAVVLALFSPRRIPPGQTWIWPFVSVRPGDAKKRLEEIKAILLHAYHYELKITSPESTPTLALEDAAGQSIAFVSFASTLGNVSGPNGIGATVDEEEKLERGPAEVVGSLAQTFRARPGIRGIRCSSVFHVDGTLVRAIGKGDSITNYVARIGERHLPEVKEGLLAVAAWEEARGDVRAAERIRAHEAKVTADSYSVPTWLGNPSIGAPEDGSPWTAAHAAVATRIEAEAADESILEGLTRADYWLRENASVVPDGAAGLTDADFEIVGELRRYHEETPEDRWYG